MTLTVFVDHVKEMREHHSDAVLNDRLDRLVELAQQKNADVAKLREDLLDLAMSIAVAAITREN